MMSRQRWARIRYPKRYAILDNISNYKCFLCGQQAKYVIKNSEGFQPCCVEFRSNCPNFKRKSNYNHQRISARKKYPKKYAMLDHISDYKCYLCGQTATHIVKIERVHYPCCGRIKTYCLKYKRKHKSTEETKEKIGIAIKRNGSYNLTWLDNVVVDSTLSDIYFGPREPSREERYYRWQMKKIFLNLNKFNNYVLEEDKYYEKEICSDGRS